MMIRSEQLGLMWASEWQWQTAGGKRAASNFLFGWVRHVSPLGTNSSSPMLARPRRQEPDVCDLAGVAKYFNLMMELAALHVGAGAFWPPLPLQSRGRQNNGRCAVPTPPMYCMELGETFDP
ncbi:hypothetical protein PI124_g15556 [Phytophthora idaei]|nr:hypothetical protein PI125_g15556 [Phytophthora idaei]KAG3143575.1 hypothetical protein PI126_g14566 [Phytophthora idaei]KAG3239504.1 hypothetical protein PI124_g15556 [Phytophthora idaei]